MAKEQKFKIQKVIYVHNMNNNLTITKRYVL